MTSSSARGEQRDQRIDSTPILPVIDVAASVAFYRAAGYEVRQYEGGGYPDGNRLRIGHATA